MINSVDTMILTYIVRWYLPLFHVSLRFVAKPRNVFLRQMF